ncbi:MAG: tetratricopeptide repeat protein, partial [Candidatus Omnitrophica bacterium]|nr:tetratricopeptide repeat protein [Candidatus Omnitrophota bacterium]
MNSHLFRINIVLIILYILLVVPLWSGFLKDSDGRLAFRGLSRMISTQRQEVQDRSKMIMLNVLMPKDFEGLVAFVTPGQRADNVDWIGYLSYFEFAASVLPVPLNADAYAMSGFCQFHQGKADEAVVSYTRALEINPIFVPTYYNLAVLRFRAGEYAQASELISRMLALNAELSFKVIASSKIYADIIGEVPAFDFTKTMAGLYVDALRILVASQYRIGQID